MFWARSWLYCDEISFRLFWKSFWNSVTMLSMQLRTTMMEFWLILAKMFKLSTMHSSAVSERPTRTIVSTTWARSMLSLARSYKVSKSWKAAFLMDSPLSTLCLKGPRSTSSISSGLILVSVSANCKISRILCLNSFFSRSQLL